MKHYLLKTSLCLVTISSFCSNTSYATKMIEFTEDDTHTISLKPFTIQETSSLEKKSLGGQALSKDKPHERSVEIQEDSKGPEGFPMNRRGKNNNDEKDFKKEESFGTGIREEKNKERKNQPRLGLSIDGGGIRGIMPAIWLQELQRQIKSEHKVDEITEIFDCIGGTSIGGILSLGLAKGLAPEELVKVFSENGHDIFPQKESQWFLIKSLNYLSGYFYTRYPHEKFEDLLKTKFGSSKLSDAKTDIFITACSLDGKPLAFRKDIKKYSPLSMWEVARATSAAPTYFEAYSLGIDGQAMSLVDGGVWCNSPSPYIAGYLMNKYQLTPSHVGLLSLGTGDITEYTIPRTTGQIKVVKPIIEAMMSSNVRGNHLAMKTFLGENYSRLNVKLTKPVDLDKADENTINHLKVLAYEFVSEKGKIKLENFIKKNEDIIREKLEK